MKKLTRLCVAVIAGAALSTAAAQPPAASIHDASPSKISDWALAGVVWSDASLTKKLADQAAKESDSEQQVTRYQKISGQSATIIKAMEEFGWKQVKRSATVNDGRSGSTADGQRSIPSPSEVGAALADSLGRPADGSKEASQKKRSERTGRRNDAAELDPSIKRFDTETPAGRDDPGIDDERTGKRTPLDLDQYRVDDVIDETPGEARHQADATEDGVEAAIAAAAGRRGVGRGTVGRISLREAQTRSATLPYSKDSIYDSDDYDPDADYDIDNPLGTQFTNPESADLGDQDDDIDPKNPAKVIDGEDELIASMRRNPTAGQSRDNPSRDRGAGAKAKRSGAADVNLDRYTADRSKHVQDAHWVQFHLNANQVVWSELTTRENLNVQTRTALMKLRANMKVAMDATDNKRLQKVLRQNSFQRSL
ncbi:hypothetical protein Enr13x_07680 [Stieleria neptunia]|uniref:Uncharacterized protein n=1 Tax=Stieleria neptunia TaxID=2527979 RepID=A0A518HJI5_9BACT|nr:hypothetical protein [Stieleria neptunia]QDV40930.1 hypothetical protein Enr13x_07680 [Stieleria neptunia]